MEMNKDKYHWADDDVVFILSRDVLPFYIKVLGHDSLLNADGLLDDETYEELHETCNELKLLFLNDCFESLGSVSKIIATEIQNEADYTF